MPRLWLAGTWPENHGVSPGMGTDGDMATKYYNEEASISAWWVTFSTPQVRPHRPDRGFLSRTALG